MISKDPKHPKPNGFTFPIKVQVVGSLEDGNAMAVMATPADFYEALSLANSGLPIPRSMMQRIGIITNIDGVENAPQAPRKRYAGTVTAAGEFSTGIAAGAVVEYQVQDGNPNQTDGVFFCGERVANAVPLEGQHQAIKPVTEETGLTVNKPTPQPKKHHDWRGFSFHRECVVCGAVEDDDRSAPLYCSGKPKEEP